VSLRQVARVFRLDKIREAHHAASKQTMGIIIVKP
jgi:hypothetical protein